MITITMPVPVSANARLVRTKGRQLTNSKKYREWFIEAYREVRSQVQSLTQLKDLLACQ